MTSIEDKFENPVLTKVHGPLNYLALKTLKDEIKTNAASIHSDLGGGANGHLGLVLTPEEYAFISITPYVRHLNPPNLNIAPGTAQHESFRLREDHKEQ